MKRKMVSILALSLIASIVIPSTTAHASTSPAAPVDISKISMEDVSGINYAEPVGYYLEKEIPQGLEFIILGEDVNMAELGSISTYAANGSDYYNPTTPISKASGSKTLKGVWWGGIVKDIFTAGGGAVASATIATTNNTQSKASVKAGVTASWVSSDWMDTNVRADILEEVGISGNKAKWDLREN